MKINNSVWPQKALWVDLNKRDIKIEKISENFAKMYLGERGFNSKRLWDLVKPNVDALSPQNVLLIGVGPLCGTLVPGSGRFTVSAKSPLTDIMGSTNIGGHFGPEMRQAGYSQIIIQGKSKSPTYLWLDNDSVELRNAEHLWGMNTWETQEIIKEEIGDSNIKIITIGPAGENTVRYAAIISGLASAGGRTGMGAVMGSKNLKAIVVRGTKDIEIVNIDKFKELCKFAFEEIKSHPMADDYSTLDQMELITDLETLPVRGLNPQTLIFEAGEEVGGFRYRREFREKRKACYNCPMMCKSFYRINTGKYAGLSGEGPDYGMNQMAPTLDIREMEPLLCIFNLLNQYGIDTGSFMYNVSWAMDCFEKGIITDKDTNGLSLKWGNSEAVIKLIPLIAEKKGFGKILAEGEKRAPFILGKGSEKYSYHIKGMSVAGDPRVGDGHTPGYLTSTRGGDHLRFFLPLPEEIMERLSPGISDMGDPEVIKGKGTAVKWAEDYFAAIDSTSLCKFPWGDPGTYIFKEKLVNTVAELLSAATGFSIDEECLLRIGERIYNIEKAFNSREGLTIKDDNYSNAETFTTIPVPDGPAKGKTWTRREELLKEYYETRKWDFKTGLQTRKTLENLDLHDVADELESAGAII
jgi:aldehyde:ferredoxin oxidoreductase